MDEIEKEPLVIPSSQPCPYGSIDLTEEADYEKGLQNLSRSKGFRWKSLCRVEVCAFLKALELGLHSVVRTNLLVDKICRVDLNYTDAICSNITSHRSEEAKVQEGVTDLQLYTLIFANIPRWDKRKTFYICRKKQRLHLASYLHCLLDHMLTKLADVHFLWSLWWDLYYQHLFIWWT